MQYYINGSSAEVVKYTLSDIVYVQWEFKDGFSDLSKKTFVLREGIIYENGSQKIAYKTTGTKYNEVMTQLSIDEIMQEGIRLSVHYDDSRYDKTWFQGIGEETEYRPRSCDGGYYYRFKLNR